MTDIDVDRTSDADHAARPPTELTSHLKPPNQVDFRPLPGQPAADPTENMQPIDRTASENVSDTAESGHPGVRLSATDEQTAEKLSRVTLRLEAEIREHKRTMRQLKSREAELARSESRLKDMNKALTVMFRKRNEDIEQIEKQMAHNIRDLISPALQRLKGSGLKASQQKWLEALEANLNDITSPLASKLAVGYRKLTPTEIKIASFIKYGNTNKEVARLLGISNRTVEVHRCNIRRKLGLKNRDINLRTYLLSME